MKSISIPFRIDGYGNVASTSDPRLVWAARVKSVMGTPTDQRVMRPDFGSDVVSALMSSPVPGFVETAVAAAASQWLPSITITSVEVDDSTSIDSELGIEIVYEVPGTELGLPQYSVRIP